MFVTTEDGDIPVASVHCAVIRDAAVTLIYGNDEETRADPRRWELALRETPVQSFPAEPGTYLLHAYMTDDTLAVSRSRVLGWCISADRMLYPVTTQGVNGGEPDALPVLLPDGTVDVFDDRTYPDYDEWAASAEATLRRQTRRITSV